MDTLKNPDWAAKSHPRLEPAADEEFNFDIPGYDMRRLMMAEDPLAAVNAFFVQIRTVLATIFGIRMCPYCPHCHCQDAFLEALLNQWAALQEDPMLRSAL